jgi:hypothetical protein
MNLKQIVKDWLVALGPRHFLVRGSLMLHAQAHGFRVRFTDDTVAIEKGGKTVVMRQSDFTLVPIMIEMFDQVVATVEPGDSGGTPVLDYSKPGLRRYKRWDLEILSPGLPEDDSIDAYTFKYKPMPGETVFDIGAHAGLTTYFFSRMVGDSGMV